MCIFGLFLYMPRGWSVFCGCAHNELLNSHVQLAVSISVTSFHTSFFMCLQSHHILVKFFPTSCSAHSYRGLGRDAMRLYHTRNANCNVQRFLLYALFFLFFFCFVARSRHIVMEEESKKKGRSRMTVKERIMHKKRKDFMCLVKELDESLLSFFFWCVVPLCLRLEEVIFIFARMMKRKKVACLCYYIYMRFYVTGCGQVDNTLFNTLRFREEDRIFSRQIGGI